MSGSPGPRTDVRWWGWGDPKVETAVEERVRLLLESRGIPTVEPWEPPAIESVSIPPARPIPAEVAEAAGPGSFFVDHESRVRHANGHSLADLLNRRSGVLESAPDAVVVAGGEEQVTRVLAAARDTDTAVIPFGGGTSVTGGLNPDPDRVTISLDTVGLDLAEIDPESGTAWLGAGLRGPEAERVLNRAGFTLGHFPQSWEYATIGGFAATRSAGQASNGFGRFDEMVLGLRLVTPEGVLATPHVRHASEGPSLTEVILGSEGALGVITAVEVRVAPIPAISSEAWILPDFGSGVEVTRRMAQIGELPALLRLSDPDETELNIAMSGPGGVAGRLFRHYLRARGMRGGCLLLIGFEGSPERNRVDRGTVTRMLRRAGGIGLGSGPSRSWRRNRYHGPYLREGLLDLGLVVETFETAAAWSEYLDAFARIRNRTKEALRAQGMAGEVLCHLSHAYRDAASLYFTVVASPGPAGAIGSWRAVKDAAMDELRGMDLPVSHHHGIGRDHLDGLDARLDPSGAQALRGLKSALDPSGIMNPGCLIPESGLRTP
jgi:alkyldihydroxyacetonephosphate synthase